MPPGVTQSDDTPRRDDTDIDAAATPRLSPITMPSPQNIDAHSP